MGRRAIRRTQTSSPMRPFLRVNTRRCRCWPASHAVEADVRPYAREISETC